MQTLLVLLHGKEIGQVERDRQNQLRFTYFDAWRQFNGAGPLSLSMPLASAQHPHESITPYMWGLLPDNEQTLERWAHRFGVSARNAFALLSHVGEDCAGAVQFVKVERRDALAEGSAFSSVQWLDAADIAQRLKRLRQDRTAWRLPQDVGQFSLAGAQPKTALLFHEGRWGVPSGRVPTTHILKPPSADFEGMNENEYFCMTLARRVHLPTARVEVHRFDSEMALVIERWDRVVSASGAESATSQPILRLHQEDMCQALAVHPAFKYQNEGGPGPETIVSLLRTHSSQPAEDVGTFVDVLAFNWLIAGTDAHAKNYSILHGGAGRVRLAPFYDLLSALPYDDMDPRRIKMAMKIGGKYRMRDIGWLEWRKLAQDLRLNPHVVLTRIADLAAGMLDEMPRVCKLAVEQGLTHPVVRTLAERLSRRLEQCQKAMASGMQADA
jgi:serine/threonine-protein kinase HipA